MEKCKHLLGIYSYRLYNIKMATVEMFGYVSISDDKGPVDIRM